MKRYFHTLASKTIEARAVHHSPGAACNRDQGINGKKVLILGNCITNECLRRRKNEEYLSVAARKKLLMLSNALKRCGTAVDIVSSSYAKHTHPAFIEPAAASTRVIHAPTIGFKGKLSFFKRTLTTLFSALWILMHCREYHLIIFYNYHIEYSLPALMANRLLKTRIIMDYEDGLFFDKGYQGVFYRYWEKTTYRLTTDYILVNEGLLNRIRSLKHEDIHSIVIHGFIDAELLNKHRQPKSGPVKKVVFSGNFSRGFGFDELIQYVRFIDDDITLDITGKASLAEEQELTSKISKRKNIHFHGFLPEKEFNCLLDQADGFILLNEVSSRFNSTNFPSKFFDYLSRNKFIITTKNPIFEPYFKLRNVICIYDFENELKSLKQTSCRWMTSHDEVDRIENTAQIAIQKYINEVLYRDFDAPLGSP